ncbi:hypothetical protein BCR37DRAFT_385127 [Protomyces lactucae-debilis]|uniref:Uncharacterized protein n=1 Tax=Protomyces lactucae-debilis TaxID=2754530 RepID=A0A1Y2FV66_PROLT|nr:uncharacterized protein BCR37DRAFT_385127 [Protomyces lactucae-debilis]ORY87859.1 hypothetical protein BCR37DRAFT_385127 [Protomyces lactucae-debilis]
MAIGFQRYSIFVLITALITTLYLNYQRNSIRKVKVIIKNCKVGASTFDHSGQPMHHPCYFPLSMDSPGGLPTLGKEVCPDTDSEEAVKALESLHCVYAVKHVATGVRSHLGCYHKDDKSLKFPPCLKETCRIEEWTGQKIHPTFKQYHAVCGYPVDPELIHPIEPVRAKVLKEVKN